jgi:uncharacterized protein
VIALEPHAKGVVVPIQARPGARRNGLSGVHDGRLRVAVTRAPEKGKANAAILAVLSKVLSIPKARLQILAGETSSKKRVLVSGAELEEIREKLTRRLEEQ